MDTIEQIVSLNRDWYLQIDQTLGGIEKNWETVRDRGIYKDSDRSSALFNPLLAILKAINWLKLDTHLDSSVKPKKKKEPDT